MKKLIFTIGLLFSIASFANSNPVFQKFIIENTSADANYMVIYQRCTLDAYTGYTCTMPQQIKINAQSSNYANPIVLAVYPNRAGQWALSVLKVTNLKTGKVQTYNGGCAAVGTASYTPTSVISLSPLMGNPNIIVCTTGVARK